MRVFVSGPYTAPTPEQVEANVRRACEVGSDLIEMGHVPFVPHLFHHLHAIRAQHYETWMAQDVEWLRLCDAIVCWASSPGADREVALARAMGLPVYRSVEEMESLRARAGVQVIDELPESAWAECNVEEVAKS